MRNQISRNTKKRIAKVCRKIILKIIRLGLWGLLEELLF